MYVVMRAGEGGLEQRVASVVARRHREGRRLPSYILAPELADGAPIHVDGFLVLGTRLVKADELCVVMEPERGRPCVRFEHAATEVRRGS
jgi:hypothetical protein